MRVLSCMILLTVLCATSTGCSLFKKNTNNPTPPIGGGIGGGGGAAPPKFPDPLNAPIPTPPILPTAPPAPMAPMTPMTGNNINAPTILAGTVTDINNRPVSNAYIRWVRLDEPAGGAPIDIAADVQGNFIIQGVKPGAAYRLIARTKHGDKLLAGTVLTNAPNVRVIIPVREEFASADIPPLPGTPAYEVPAAAGIANNKTPPKNTKWQPAQTKAFGNDPLVGVGTAINPNDPPNLPATLTFPVSDPKYVPGIVETPMDRPPLLNIPGQQPRPNLPPESFPALPPIGPGGAKIETGPTRVPSCAFVGKRLENLALKDSKGQVWEYRKASQGKIVLLDFWGTHCFPCRQVMPTLERIHQQYATRGLDVIGIAIEPGADERREADAVNKFCSSMNLTYRQLMGKTANFNAGNQFQVTGVPTLMLLNQKGDIVWHHVGVPDSASLHSLERTIQNLVTNRAF